MKGAVMRQNNPFDVFRCAIFTTSRISRGGKTRIHLAEIRRPENFSTCRTFYHSFTVDPLHVDLLTSSLCSQTHDFSLFVLHSSFLLYFSLPHPIFSSSPPFSSVSFSLWFFYHIISKLHWCLSSPVLFCLLPHMILPHLHSKRHIIDSLTVFQWPIWLVLFNYWGNDIISPSKALLLWKCYCALKQPLRNIASSSAPCILLLTILPTML